MSENQPNILLITTDQMRWDFMGCAGADFVRTPNLDQLAARGMLFENCFSNSPVCVPARIGLATGMQPAVIGAVDNASFLMPQFTTYYQRLRDAGYRVGCSGKLDLAKPDQYNGRDGARPRTYQWGFTDPCESEGKGHSLGHPTPHGPYGDWLEKQGLYEAYRKERRKNESTPGGHESWYTPSELPAKTFLDVYQGQRAVQWLHDTTVDSPWHLFVSFSGPHRPHDPPREYYDRYAEAPMLEPVSVAEDGRSAAYQHNLKTKCGPKDPELVQRSRRAYCAYIELIDEQIGQILEAVEQRGEADNTYVFFSSDHGEMLGDLGLWTKSLPYEPSIHVPLLVAGPDIPPGAISKALVELIDLNPTICELAGLPEQAYIHARSFVPSLHDSSTPHRTEAVAAMRRWWLIRTERYKFIQNWNDTDELYDLQADPAESCNCIEQMRSDDPDLVNDLCNRLNMRFAPNPYRQHQT